MKKIRILIVNGGLMDRGGISSFICNYVSNFDKKKFSIDIIVHGLEKGKRDDEILNKGVSEIFNVPPKKNGYFKWKKKISSIIKKGEYDIIFANADAGNGPILKIAYKYNIGVRISHSHNTKILTNNKIRILLNKLQKKQIFMYATQLYACSQAAGEWLYGKKNKFEIVNNAINYDNFKFSENDRKYYREKLKVNNENVIIGHVGRFDYQKNHEFIMKIAQEIQDKQYKFLFIGDGQTRTSIEEYITKNKLENCILLGETDNVSGYLSAMDLFILPSRFEGLSVVSIEAQVNGLKCLFSDTITRECVISSENVEFLNIENPILWKNAIQKHGNLSSKKRNIKLDDKYNIKVQAKYLENRLINLCNKEDKK